MEEMFYCSYCRKEVIPKSGHECPFCDRDLPWPLEEPTPTPEPEPVVEESTVEEEEVIEEEEEVKAKAEEPDEVVSLEDLIAKG